MTPDLATKLMPYLSYFLYAQLMLICSLVIVGGILVLKRVMKKQPFEGDVEFDHERIAAELNTEIARLRDLRNRLYPSKDPIDPNAVMSPEDMAALRVSIEKDYKDKIEKLEQELVEAKASAGTGTPSAGGDENTKQELAKAQNLAKDWEKKYTTLNKEHEALSKGGSAKETADLQTKIANLEAALSEYEIFEEEFSMVKKYKSEIEDLRAQIAESGRSPIEQKAPKASASAASPLDVSAPQTEEAPAAEPVAAQAAPAPTPAAPAPTTPAPAAAAPASAGVGGSTQLTNDDIAKLFADLENVQSEPSTAAAAAPAPAPAPEAAPEAAPAANVNLDDELSQLLAEAEAPPPDQSPETELKVTAAPSAAADMPAPTGQDLEAAAEAAASGDDDLIAEFEKLLGSTPKDQA